MPDSNGINQGWGYNPGLGYNPAFPPAPKPAPSRAPMRPPAYKDQPRVRGGSPADSRRSTKPVRDSQANTHNAAQWWADRLRQDRFQRASSYDAQIEKLKATPGAGANEFLQALALKSLKEREVSRARQDPGGYGRWS